MASPAISRSELLHLARLAAAESAASALLREAASDCDPSEEPDEVVIRCHAEGMEVEYMRGGLPLAGEGI